MNSLDPVVEQPTGSCCDSFSIFGSCVLIFVLGYLDIRTISSVNYSNLNSSLLLLHTKYSLVSTFIVRRHIRK